MNENEERKTNITSVRKCENTYQALNRCAVSHATLLHTIEYTTGEKEEK